MATQPESKLSRQIMTELRRRGAWVMKIHGNEYMTVGAPDVMGVWRGMFIAVETKMPGKEHTVSPRQAYVHEQIRAAGGACVVATSVAQAVELLEAAIRDA